MDYENLIARAKERDVQQLIAAAGAQGSRRLQHVACTATAQVAPKVFSCNFVEKTRVGDVSRQKTGFARPTTFLLVSRYQLSCWSLRTGASNRTRIAF
jgi:hypothetical protein